MENFFESIGAVAEMVALYYTCLVKAGASEEAAVTLTGLFQENFLNQVHERKNSGDGE